MKGTDRGLKPTVMIPQFCFRPALFLCLTVLLAGFQFFHSNRKLQNFLSKEHPSKGFAKTNIGVAYGGHQRIKLNLNSTKGSLDEGSSMKWRRKNLLSSTNYTIRKANSNHLPQHRFDLGNLSLLPGPIFYNVFVPDTNLRESRRIVGEQLLQRNLTCYNESLLYTLIGNGSFHDFMDEACNSNSSNLSGLRCSMREHLSDGNEVHTLQALWQYCQSNLSQDPSEDIIVSYIHNKGSFHHTETNEKARRLGTKAALECRKELTRAANPRACNICTGAFHVFPQYLGSANMWTARCSYIRQLHAPHNYSAILQHMYDTTLNHSTLQYSAQYSCLKPYHNAPNFWGVGRYSMERWPFSHPNVKPCDILPFSEGKVPWDEFPQTWKPKLRKAPRQTAKASGIETGPYKSTFARLPGRLFEWRFVYGMSPPTKSWVWKWYKGYEQGSPGFLRKCHSLIRNSSEENTTRMA